MSKIRTSSKLIAASALSFGVSYASAGMKTISASDLPNTVNNPQAGEVIVKCAGIAKKGKNHCGANGHSCGGKAVKDFDPNEWIYVRKEVCDATPGKVVGQKKVTKG